MEPQKTDEAKVAQHLVESATAEFARNRVRVLSFSIGLKR